MFFKHAIQTSSIKSNYVESTVYLIQDPTKNSSTTFINVARTRNIYMFFQALFNDIILKYTNSSTFKALKIVKSNSSTFKVFKHPYEP